MSIIMALTEKRIFAFLIAKQLDLKGLKNEFPANIFSGTLTDLFYKDGEKYINILDYGAVAYTGYTNKEMQSWNQSILKYASTNVKFTSYKEDFVVKETGTGGILFDHSSLSVPKIVPNLLRIAMVNVCQSVALDYYTELSRMLL